MTNWTSTDSGVFLTIPPNTMFLGYVSLAASLSLAAGAGAVSALVKVIANGTGMNFKDQDVVCSLALAAPAVALASLVGVTTADSIMCGELHMRTSAAQCTLSLSLPAGVTGIASAFGEMRI